MSWSDIKTSGIPKDVKIQERRKVGRIIIELLHKSLPARDRFNVFQMNIDRFLTLMHEQHCMSPNEVLTSLIQQPDLLKAIYRNKFKKVKDHLLQKDQTSTKERTFVTLFYDRYYVCRSFFRAVFQTYKYPFENFSPDFVRNIFTKYPFLRKPDHLKHIVYLLERVDSAYYLTQNGIKEEYNSESILSHLDS